jgi:hypothetical protein
LKNFPAVLLQDAGDDREPMGNPDLP